MEIIEIISNTFRKKVVFIYYLVVIIFILFTLNYLLTNYLYKMKLNNFKETFQNKKTKEDKKETNNKKQTNNNKKETNNKKLNESLNKLQIKSKNKSKNKSQNDTELNKVLEFNNRDKYSCLTNDEKLKESACIKMNNEEASIRLKIKNDKFKHNYKDDSHIEYYSDKNIPKDTYLQYYSKKFKDYQKKPKNETNYFIKMNNNSNILYTNKFDSKISGEFKKDNLENVKELNYHKLSNKSSYYKDLPLRNYREKCFKCQRPYMICNDNHIPSKIDNKAYVNVSQEQKNKRELLIQKLKKEEDAENSETQEQKLKEMKIEKEIEIKRQKQLQSIVYKDYPKRITPKKIDYKKLKKQGNNNNELNEILKFNLK